MLAFCTPTTIKIDTPIPAMMIRAASMITLRKSFSTNADRIRGIGENTQMQVAIVLNLTYVSRNFFFRSLYQTPDPVFQLKGLVLIEKFIGLVLESAQNILRDRA